MYDWLAGDAQFKAAFNDALLEAVENLEHEAFRRAVKGWDKPVYQKGQQPGVVRKYSDRMLELPFKERKPEVYGTHRVESKVDEKVAAVQEFDLSMLSDEQPAVAQAHIDALATICKAAEAARTSERRTLS